MNWFFWFFERTIFKVFPFKKKDTAQWNFWNLSLDGPNVAYQSTDPQLSFGNEQFGDSILETKTVDMNSEYVIRMYQVKQDSGEYLFTIEVNGLGIFQETDLFADFSSSTNVYFSNGPSLDAEVQDVMIFNGHKDGNYHGM